MAGIFPVFSPEFRLLFLTSKRKLPFLYPINRTSRSARHFLSLSLNQVLYTKFLVFYSNTSSLIPYPILVFFVSVKPYHLLSMHIMHMYFCTYSRDAAAKSSECLGQRSRLRRHLRQVPNGRVLGGGLCLCCCWICPPYPNPFSLGFNSTNENLKKLVIVF